MCARGGAGGGGNCRTGLVDARSDLVGVLVVIFGNRHNLDLCAPSVSVFGRCSGSGSDNSGSAVGWAVQVGLMRFNLHMFYAAFAPCRANPGIARQRNELNVPGEVRARMATCLRCAPSRSQSSARLTQGSPAVRPLPTPLRALPVPRHLPQGRQRITPRHTSSAVEQTQIRGHGWWGGRSGVPCE